MQKMEDQNVQLVRLAEQQKQEYNKVRREMPVASSAINFVANQM